MLKFFKSQVENLPQHSPQKPKNNLIPAIKVTQTGTYLRLLGLIVEEALANLPKDVTNILGYSFISPFYEALLHMRKHGIAFVAYVDSKLFFNKDIRVVEDSNYAYSGDYNKRFTFSYKNEPIMYSNILVFGNLLNQVKGKFVVNKYQSQSILNYENALIKFYQKIDDGYAWLFKIQGYNDARLGKDRESKAIAQRVQELANRDGSSVSIVDKEDDFINTQLDLSWFENFIHEYKSKICVDFNTPFTKLFGESASGLMATGEGDRKAWLSSVLAFQVIYLMEPLVKLAELMGKSKEFANINLEAIDSSDKEATAKVNSIKMSALLSAFSTGLVDRTSTKAKIEEILGINQIKEE